MKTKFPWLKMRKKTQPEIPYETPIWMGSRSNGEYFHQQTPYEKKLRNFVLRKADENARRLGLDRREFLASAMGMATTLWCIGYASGCSSDDSAPPAGAGGTGGGLCVPPQAMFDEDVACAVIGGNGEFIFDVQTHWFSTTDMERFPDAVKATFAPLGLSNQETYVNGMFLQSDTHVAVLTSWPGTYCINEVDPCGMPLSNETMARSRDEINMLACNTQRVVQHFQLLPTDLATIEQQMEMMTELHCRTRVQGWKMYPGFNPSSIDSRLQRGYFLTDEPARRLIRHGIKLGVKTFSVHKGLAIGTYFEAEHNHPRDVGPAAKEHPDANFIIYHSGICSGMADPATGNSVCRPRSQFIEGPYVDKATDPEPLGVNAFIRSLEEAGIAPNSNVYAEVGSAINQVMTDPIASQHFFGKLMKYVGTERVVWGTDCLATSPSPQNYIEWFRTLEISEQLQQEHGYPPLNAEQKAKIFGLNAAKVYGVDPEARRCEVNSCPTAQLKRDLDGEFGPRRSVFQKPSGPETWEEYVEQAKQDMARGRPG
jgi:predicted TIM-barrel fold metal-dependent hydrolase